MRAKGIFLFLFLVVLTFILVSNVSASTINRTYTVVGGNITCDKVSVNTMKAEVVTAGNPIFVVYKGEKIRFLNSTGGEMRNIRIDGKFTSTGVSSSNFKTFNIYREWDTEGKYEGYYRFSDDTNGNGVYFENLMYLFSIDEELEENLNNGTIPEELKDGLNETGFSLSEDTTIERKAKYEWVITDKEDKNIYITHRETYEVVISIYISTIDYQGWLSLDTHTFRLDLYPTDKTYEDGTLNFSIESNNKEAGFMKFSIESRGHSIKDVHGNDIYEIPIEYKEETKFYTKIYNITNDISGVNISADGEIMLNMSGLDVEEGRYTIIIEDSATGVEKKINFEIEPREIEIKVEDEIAKGEKAEIIVESAFSNKNANLFINGVFNQNATLNDEGEKMFRWDTTNVPFGRHEIRIRVDVDGDGVFEGYEDESASCYIKVIEGEVTVTAPDEVIIGNPVVIGGTSTYGVYAVILIADKYVDKAMIDRKKFEYEYKTTGEMEGSNKVEIFIDAPIEFGIGEAVSEEWKRENKVDADTDFTLVESRELTLDVPYITASGDDVLISGTAAGVDKVYLLVLNQKGEVVFPYAAKAMATPVDEEGEWDEKLIKPDAGTYTVIVLHEGREGVTDAIYNGNWEIGDELKTLEQRIAIVEDKIKGAGSDDIFLKREFKVVNPEVRLELEDATFGETLTIVATTNVKEGVIAWLSVGKEGVEDKEIKTVKVENGTIMAEFDTNKLSVGRWEVSVNIPDRCLDEGVININAKAPTPASTATPIATVTPLPTPTPSAISISEEKINSTIPGFELAISLFMLIAVAYLIRKRGI